VLEKALGWQQELAARVAREQQEEPGIPVEERTESATLLVNLATEATMTVKALSITFPDVFKAVASRKASFPINIPALPEDRDEIIHWLTETLQLGSEHELKLRGRKTFSRRTFANKLLLYYIRRIKMRAIELLQFRIDNLFQLEALNCSSRKSWSCILRLVRRQPENGWRLSGNFCWRTVRHLKSMSN
jgi:hypothetical protein